MWNNYKYLFLLLILISITRCNTTEPPPDEQAINLKLEDVSCTEIWIELTTTNLQLPATVILKQTNPTGDTKSHILNLNTKDSLLYIDSLLPNKNYQYQVSSNQCQVSSNKLSVSTMDTTSHNFTWQTWTFGEHSSSVLYDVAIIDENSIYVVGEIYMNDTHGQPDPYPYNLAIWDGNNWELMKLTYQGFPPVIHSICAINESNIWFDPWFHWNGQNFQELPVDPVFNGVGINKMWGNEDEIYVVGDEGFIAQRSANGSWHSIESGTDLNIYDICGDYKSETGEYEIIAVAAKIAVNFDKAIIKINETGTVTLLPTIGIPYSIHGIWFKPSKQYYICGAGMFNKKVINSSNPWNELEITNYYTEAISGNGINDIAICGDFGESLHFNGISWKSYQDNFSGVLLLGVKIKDDQIVIVGIDNPKAFITIGRR